MFLTIEIDIEFCLKVIHFLGEITIFTISYHFNENVNF